MTMISYDTTFRIHSSFKDQVEDLAWDYCCLCITHQPPTQDAWPAEIATVPQNCEIDSFVSFEDETKAQEYAQALREMGIEAQVIKKEIGDWLDYHRPYMQPIVLDKLTILPQCPPENSGEFEINTLYLPAGLAFGTGHHATTRSCLILMQQVDLKNKNIIDFGCGSGILGLAALLLGAQKVMAHDLDAQALLATQNNAKSHHLQDRMIIKSLAKDLHQSDILLANILLEPLIQLAPLFSTLVFSSGYAVFAGILTKQREEFLETYKKYFEIIKEIQDEDWSSFLLKRK